MSLSFWFLSFVLVEPCLKKIICLLIILVLHKWINTQSGSLYRPKFISYSWFHLHTSNNERIVVETVTTTTQCQIQIVWVLWIVKCQFLRTSISPISTPCYRDFNVSSISNMCVEKSPSLFIYTWAHQYNMQRRDSDRMYRYEQSYDLSYNIVFPYFTLKKALYLLDTTDKFELNHSQCHAFRKSTMTLFTTNEHIFIICSSANTHEPWP